MLVEGGAGRPIMGGWAATRDGMSCVQRAQHGRTVRDSYGSGVAGIQRRANQMRLSARDFGP